LLKDS